MKKHYLAATLAVTLTCALLSGCGSASTSTGAAASTAAAGTSAAAAGTSAAATAASSGAAASGQLTVIKVAASPTPHAEILAHVKDQLKAEGYDLQVTEFEDYVQPNEVVESGEFDANYFQHQPYLDSFNEEKGTHIVSVGKIHYEPMGIYPGTKKSLDDVADGDSIAVPNDTTNEARALLLLQDNGLIKLKDGAGLTATVNDIAENTHNLKIVEVEAAQVSHQLDSVAYAVMNGNYAKEAGFSVAKDAIKYEGQDSEAAKTYVNIVAVKQGNETNPGIVALVAALKSDDTKKWINDNYDGAVIAYDGE
ncbi:MAG: MetQ/NlpA family ABC transporter substrate-binding protein [Lachnospiraceae bacterium]|jgi:D-methionine transport system substrate-binding protein|nr:MetQ/NlpA family ABC transporter substrate-binding protein [Lachnospiraceae bacterium]